MDQNWCKHNIMFIISENMAKSFRGATFLTHTVCIRAWIGRSLGYRGEDIFSICSFSPLNYNNQE